MLHYDDRFKDAPWYEKSKNEQIILIGAGGIGGNALYCLTKTIPCRYYILDDDKVVEHNIGTQFFNTTQVGQYKVSALKETLIEQTTARLHILTKKHTVEYTPIMIIAVDNMKARKQAFKLWKEANDRELFIDGRLRANLYEVYAVTPGQEEEYEKTLFDDSEVDEGPCTFKQTAYFGMLIGARITHIVVNYLTNKYSIEPICIVPFKVSEVGEPFLIEVV